MTRCCPSLLLLISTLEPPFNLDEGRGGGRDDGGGKCGGYLDDDDDGFEESIRAVDVVVSSTLLALIFLYSFFVWSPLTLDIKA